MEFSNSTIDVQLLPQVDQRAFIPLESGYKKVILIENIIFSSILLIIFSALLIFGDVEEFAQLWYLPFVGLGILAIFFFWFRPKAFARKGYQLRERDILFRSGLWWQEETVIPFARVQHTEVTQGPLARLLGFSTLKLYTAGGSRSDLKIPALHPDTAQKLEHFVSQKADFDESL